MALRCQASSARSQRDFRALERAWKRFHAAEARLQNLKVYGRHSTAGLPGARKSKKLSRSSTKARIALDQADRDVRAASARVEQSLKAVRACFRKGK